MCLRKIINKNHDERNYIFSPSLASSSYENQSVTWMTENINFVPKEIIPPSILHARSIENFWGDLTQKIYENGWEAK